MVTSRSILAALGALGDFVALVFLTWVMHMGQRIPYASGSHCGGVGHSGGSMRLGFLRRGGAYGVLALILRLWHS